MNWVNMLMPEAVELDESSYSTQYGRFVVQPLERGFAVTLGNLFRRVLLSSIQGAAITAIRVDGVHHEFATIKGVKEDLTEVILNLKEVRIKRIRGYGRPAYGRNNQQADRKHFQQDQSPA